MSKIPDHAKKVFKGQIFDVYQWAQEMYDGSTHTFEKIVRPPTAVMIPVTEDHKIIICEQEQPHRSKPYLSLISGRVEKNEDPKEAAQRELLEETGYMGSEIILWDEFKPNSKIDWNIYTYIIKGCKKVTGQKLDPGEKIKLDFITFDEFIDLLVQKKVSVIQLTVKALEAKLEPPKMEALKKLLFD